MKKGLLFLVLMLFAVSLVRGVSIDHSEIFLPPPFVDILTVNWTGDVGTASFRISEEYPAIVSAIIPYYLTVSISSRQAVYRVTREELEAAGSPATAESIVLFSDGTRHTLTLDFRGLVVAPVVE